MKNICRGLVGRWFAESSAVNLAVLRLLVGGFSLHYLTSRFASLMRVAESDQFLFDPVGPIELLQRPLPPEIFQSLLCLTIALNVAFVLGLGFRCSGPAFSILLLVVLSYRNSWSMIYHSNNLLLLHVFVLGWTRAADGLSVDQLARTWHRRTVIPAPGRSAAAAGSWVYGWPVRLICLVTAITYFLAGLAKVAGPVGWNWAQGSSLRLQMAADAIRKELLDDGASVWFWQIYDHVWIFAAMAVATLVLEFGAPFALIDKRSAAAWALTVVLFHWGIFFTMGITFRYQLTCVAFASFVDWDRILQPLSYLLAGRHILPRTAKTVC